ncbi:thioredoxin family protein [Portibacter marinus]|uniref:thioredoxin family protein n=1 Tax=Portibacter marinus TaxID=2898660 RepID=UPI001F1CAC95|nr:thioredoxin domain-containing protein [Portibacter marinus]
MKISIQILLVIFLALSCTTTHTVLKEDESTKNPDKMDFNHNSSVSLSNVVDQAVASNKLIFVDFYTDWCTPCKLMDEDVFVDEKFADYMKSKFINYKVNAEKDNGPNLGVMFGVAGYPTLLILDQRGRVLERNEGALYQTGLKAMARRALDKAAL